MSLQVGLALVAVALFIVTAIGQAVAGPARWVRLATVGLLLSAAATGMAWLGPVRGGLGLLGIILFSQLATFIAMTTWRQPVETRLLPADPEDCPFHARDAANRWSTELWEKLGFEHVRDGWFSWTFAGQTKRSFSRFFRHRTTPCFVEISILEDPKVAGRLVVSVDEAGRSVVTADRMPDTALLKDELTSSQQVKPSATCAEMLRAHADKVAELGGGRWLVVEDPVAMRAQLRTAWISRLLAGGTLRRVGDDVAVVRSRLPGMQLAVIASWLR